MPVSNFWIDCDIDGRETKLEGGPAAKDDGFLLKLTMRDRGQIVEVLTIDGQALGSKLVLNVWGPHGLLLSHETRR